MPDDSLKRHLRSRIIEAGGPRMLSAVARHRGFPSAAALETALAIGSRLAGGESLTHADVAAVAKHYPHVPHNVLYAYAGRINGVEPGHARRDAMVHYWGFGQSLDAAAQEIESYTNADYARGIAAKRAERDRDRDRDTDPEPTADDRNHPVRRHNEDAASRRALLEAQMGEERDFRPNSGYGSTMNQLADRMDEQAERYDLAEINAHANGRERSRTDDIAYAIDHDHTMQQADALMGAQDLIEPLSEATSGENPS